MNIKSMITALAAAASLGAFAAGYSVKIDSVQQRYPWNGIVDVGYTLSGIEDGKAYDLVFGVARSNATTNWFRIAGAKVANGAQTAAFNTSEVLGGGVIDTGCSMQVRLQYGNAAITGVLPFPSDRTHDADDQLYCIIDVTGGSGATSYPVTYTNRIDDLTTTDAYRKTKIVLKRVKAGTFTMGSPTSESGREGWWGWSKETQHPVTLTKDFYIGVFEITQDQYYNVMGLNPSYFTSNTDAAMCPVERVKYTDIRGATDGCDVTKLGTSASAGAVDATSFMGKLRSKTTLNDFDLPTEAQWEFACRGGQTTATYIGSNSKEELNQIAWWGNNGSDYKEGNSDAKTHAAGGLQPNALGLYDMLGNAWEWCRDRVTPSTQETPLADDWGTAKQVDPIRGVVGGTVALRGGGWSNDPASIRCAIRDGYSGVSHASNNIGFRLARTIP